MHQLNHEFELIRNTVEFTKKTHKAILTLFGLYNK